MPKDLIKRVSDKVKDTMEKRATATAGALRPAFETGDAEKISKSTWMQMIRDNWADPAWRQRQGIQRDQTKFVQDALEAFGLNPSLLHQNADVMRLGLSQWNVDATAQYLKNMEEFGGHVHPSAIPPMPMGQEVDPYLQAEQAQEQAPILPNTPIAPPAVPIQEPQVNPQPQVPPLPTQVLPIQPPQPLVVQPPIQPLQQLG